MVFKVLWTLQFLPNLQSIVYCSQIKINFFSSSFSTVFGFILSSSKGCITTSHLSSHAFNLINNTHLKKKLQSLQHIHRM